MHQINLVLSSLVMIVAAFVGLIVWRLFLGLFQSQGETAVHVIYLEFADHSFVAGALLIVLGFILARFVRLWVNPKPW